MSDRASAPIVNYHTHTWRCMHARGTEEQFVREAIRTGYSVLGFSDHTPWPYASDFVSGMRMRLDQFDDYRRTVLGLREKYAGQIEIPLGLECEAFPEYMGWLRDLKAEALDYVILGNHYYLTDEGNHRALEPGGGFYFGRTTTPEQARRYGERTIAGIETGLFDFLAHPDLFLHVYPAFDADCRAVCRDICQAAAQYGMPLEYNLLGLFRRGAEAGLPGLGYTTMQFWEIAAQYDVRAIIGFDAHNTELLVRRDMYRKAHETLVSLGIPVIDRLPGL